MTRPHERLITARELAGYKTAADAARAMGVRKETYQAHENGWRGFDRSAKRYADFFRVSLDWLIAGRGEPKKPLYVAEKNQHSLERGKIVTDEARVSPVTLPPNGLHFDLLTEVDVEEATAHESGGSEVKHIDIATWGLPIGVLSAQFGVAPGQAQIVEVHGEAMLPEFRPGDRVIVNTRDTEPIEEGLFAIIRKSKLMVRHLGAVEGSVPERVKITALNKGVPSELVVPLSEVVVVGRVIGEIKRRY